MGINKKSVGREEIEEGRGGWVWVGSPSEVRDG